MSKTKSQLRLTEAQRLEVLDMEIHEMFAHVDPEFDDIEVLGSQSIGVLMFEVTKAGKKGLELVEFNLGFEYRPVIFPREIGFLLKKGDVFMATLGKLQDRWLLLWMGPLFIEVDWCEGCPECAKELH